MEGVLSHACTDHWNAFFEKYLSMPLASFDGIIWCLLLVISVAWIAILCQRRVRIFFSKTKR